MSNELEVHRPIVKASSELSAYLGMEVPAMIDALKSQCFKGKRPEEVTNAQLATYISTANALKLNPLLPGQLYAFPDRQGGGVTVMIGPDGVFTLLSNHPDIVAQKDGGPAFWTEHGVDSSGKETCTGYINHRTKGLLKKMIWVDEWAVSSNPNWQTRRHHMSEVRALKQTARMVIHGLPIDSDEQKLGEMLNVTDTGDAQENTDQPEVKTPARPTPPPRQKKGPNAAAEAKAGDKAIDVETVPPKPATTTAAPAETQSEQPPAEQKKVEPTAEPKTAEKPVEKVAEKPATTAAPRSELKVDERITVKCVVEKVFVLMIKLSDVPTPSIQANVKGGFVGPVYHFGAAKRNEAGDLVALPPWKDGIEVVLELFGRANPKTGAVNAKVEKVALAEGSADTPIDVG